MNLLGFLEAHAPDPVTRRVTHLARVDESRHVAFGMAHLEHHAQVEPALRGRLRGAIERRHGALMETVGLNQQVFDAMVVLAAGSWTPSAIGTAYAAVQQLQEQHQSDAAHQVASFIQSLDSTLTDLVNAHPRAATPPAESLPDPAGAPRTGGDVLKQSIEQQRPDSNPPPANPPSGNNPANPG